MRECPAELGFCPSQFSEVQFQKVEVSPHATAWEMANAHRFEGTLLVAALPDGSAWPTISLAVFPYSPSVPSKLQEVGPLWATVPRIVRIPGAKMSATEKFGGPENRGMGYHRFFREVGWTGTAASARAWGFPRLCRGRFARRRRRTRLELEGSLPTVRAPGQFKAGIPAPDVSDSTWPTLARRPPVRTIQVRCVA